MSKSQWSDEHQRLLSETAPAALETANAQVERVWDRVAARTGEVEPRRRSRRFRVAVGVAVGAVVLGTSAVASAQFNSAHTGRGPIDAEDRRLGGPGERLNPATTDFADVLAEATKDIPFPSAASRAFALEDQVSDLSSDGSATVATGAVRAWVADAAVCSWTNQWAKALKTGDGSLREEAVSVLLADPSWPAVTDLDPNPSSVLKTEKVTGMDGVTRTEKFIDETQFYYLASLGRAAQGSNHKVVADLLAANNGYCRAELVPDIPHANGAYGH